MSGALPAVLVVDKLTSFLANHPAECNVTVFEEAETIPAGSYVGILPVVTTRVTAADMDRIDGLKVIANYGVGYDNIDVAAARARGIAVTNTPGVLTNATAELTWALILAAARRVGEGERLVRSGEWSGWAPTQLRGMGLDGKVLGIVGAGRIGRAVGARAVAFGMSVCYWNRGTRAELAELLAASDVVSIHLAKAAGTERLIDPRFLKDGAILINTARGAIIDEDVLVHELKKGRISAGLDVYVHEPHVPQALRNLENVVLLPHLGSATYEARQAMWDLAWQNLVAGVSGKRLLNPI